MSVNKEMKYIKGMLHSLRKKELRHLGDMLKENEVVTDDLTLWSDTKKILDVSDIDKTQWIFKALEERKKQTIEILSVWEYKRFYKYSSIFKVNDVQNNIINPILSAPTINQNQKLYKDFKKPALLEEKEYFFLKYNIKYTGFDPIDEKKRYIKYPVVIIMYKNMNIIEVRFDGISSNFNREKFSYLEVVKFAKQWLQNNTNVEFEFINLDKIVQDIIDNEEENRVVIYGQMMNMASGSSAQLDIGKSDKYILPFIGELKNMLSNHQKEFDDAPKIKELLEDFIKEKEELSDYPWIILRWVHKEHKSKNKDVKFIFNYHDTDICLLHHYSNASIGMERMNYVTKYLIQN